MSDSPENLVLSLLRAIRTDIAEIKETLRETQMRLYALELNYVSMRPQLDRVAGDVQRIKRRLELTEVDMP
jgi:gamma-glutamylcyclotransferase (GGCT)/AIG2-like uncharacterized protein YtfP